MTDNVASVNHEAFSTSPNTIELVKRAAQDGATDASEAAAKTWEATSLFVRRFVYTTCYTLSYGVVFPSVLIARSIPKNNAVVRGLSEGAQAAIQKVDEIKQNAAHESCATVHLPAFVTG